jgi:N-acetyl-gamma-glutamyl-phosphate reductase
MYCTVNENFQAYGVGTHRHRPEIEQVIARKTGTLPSVIFTPHLVAMDRGIFTTTYSLPAKAADEKELIACLRDFYKNEQFVRVMDTLPSVKAVAHTNFCDMTVRVVRNRVMTLSCIDNLVKGASGAALQNFNILYGYPENTALI